MKTPLTVLFAIPFCLGLPGCSGLFKPAPSSERHFVLTALPAADDTAQTLTAPAIGLGRVKLPDYLFDTSLAVRQAPNEIRYLPLVLWAERLDVGLQRVLAANLGSLLPSEHIRLSAWRRDHVDVEVHVTIEQFDIHTSGEGVLTARWRIVSPGGAETLEAGESHGRLSGPAPDVDPSGAVATLSSLAADLSRELAHAIRESLPSPPKSPAP
jgi:uncharacterized lipoprotein YmbA